MEGITLHSRRFQEFHKDVTFLSRDGGIFQAVLHGGYKGKSRFAGATEPFRHVKFLLYHNPVKDSYKISDGELLNAFDSFRTDLPRIYMASRWAELFIRTRGIGAAEEDGRIIFKLLLDSLIILETIERKNLSCLNIQFLWRFLNIAGFGLDARNCGNCGTVLSDQAEVVFSNRDNVFLCGGCGVLGERLSIGIVKYLNYSLERELEVAVLVSPPGGGREFLERIPLDFFRGEMELVLKSPDYNQFI